MAAIPAANVTQNAPSAGTNEVSQVVGGLPSGDQAATEADAGIIQRIRKSFLTDNVLAGADQTIHIACTNGDVTLTGTAPSDQVKMGLGDKAKAVADVKSVNNQLEVK
jgi:osmotically-inducible protein OsmY